MSHLDIEDLTIAYPSADGLGEFVALDGLSLSIDRGTFVTILGPSGCGKSSLLLAVDGLVAPARGRVRIDGRIVTGPGRERAMVFQEFALMPWRTVLENVRFGLELQRVPARDANATSRQLIELVGLSGFEHHHPHQLSGGMRQRVGIARALAVEPEILLMDEPFGALDAQTREVMGRELLRIWRLNAQTTLFVTHSIDEAIFLGDRVVVLTGRPGRIRESVTIDLPRPRTVEMTDTPVYAACRRRIRALLTECGGPEEGDG